MHWIWSVVAGLTAQQVRVRNHGTGKRLHLTFDDGPHPECTPMLLDVLAQCDAKATFFLLGRHAQAHPELVARIAREGHTIANHSMTHPNFRTLGPRAQLSQIDQADAVLAPFDGRKRHPFRPPRGATTLTTIVASVLRAQPLILWSFDSFDFRLPEAELQARLEAYQPAPGDILLFHDDMSSTVAVLQRMLPRWRDAGYQLTAV